MNLDAKTGREGLGASMEVEPIAVEVTRHIGSSPAIWGWLPAPGHPASLAVSRPITVTIPTSTCRATVEATVALASAKVS